MANTSSAHLDNVKYAQTALTTQLAAFLVSVATLSTTHASAVVAMSSTPTVATSATMVTACSAMDNVIRELDLCAAKKTNILSRIQSLPPLTDVVIGTSLLNNDLGHTILDAPRPGH